MRRDDLRRRAPPAFDRAVHIPLPLDAGVFAGKEEPPAGPREPRAERRIETRVEVRIAAARQRIVLPDDLPGRDKRRALRSQPVERVGQALRPFPREDLLRRGARAAPGQQRENARPSPLFFAERLSSVQWIGSAIVLAGVAVLSMSGVATGVRLQADQSG